MSEAIHDLPSLPSALLAGVPHGFLTRQGGVSEGLYASLNCALASRDRPEHVQENRRRAAASLALPPERLMTLAQQHGAHCHIIASAEDIARHEGDAMATRLPGVALGILTADCAPVLFFDPAARVIGAAHAGWKGAFGGVIEAAVAAMETLGARREGIRAVVGPCIAAPSYEVDEGFYRRFHGRGATEEWFSPAQKPGHWQFDLPAYVSARLSEAGVGLMEILPFDTYSDEARFFSFRRATHRQEEDYGRQLSLIALP